MIVVKSKNAFRIWAIPKILIVLFCLLVSQNLIAQSWDLSPLFKAARKGAKLGYDGLERIQKMSETLTSGKEVQEMTTDWEKMAVQFEDAADKIKRAPLPSDFNMELFKLDVPSINCATKQDVINSATAYLDALQKSQINSHFVQEQTASFITMLNLARKDLDVLQAIYTKLLPTPLYDKLWSEWLDIDKFVEPALFHLTKAAKEHLTKLQLEFKKVKMKISNLSGNLALIKAMKCGGIFRCQPLSFPNNIISQECKWNYNLSNVLLQITIDATEKLISEGRLTFTEIQEPINNNKCVAIKTYNYDCKLKKFTVSNSTVYVEFTSDVDKLYFTGTKQKDIITGSLVLEPLPVSLGPNQKSFRIVQNITLNLQ